MRRIDRTLAYVVAVTTVVAVTPASACIPPNIPFDYGSTSLDDADREQLNGFIKSLRKEPSGKLRLVIESDGSKANVRMAKVRAEVIKTALVRRGVSPSKIEIESRVRRNPLSRLVFVEINSVQSC